MVVFTQSQIIYGSYLLAIIYHLNSFQVTFVNMTQLIEFYTIFHTYALATVLDIYHIA